MSYDEALQTLNVSPESSAEEINKAYKKLMLRYHPDLNKDPDALTKATTINAARDLLMDPLMSHKGIAPKIEYTINFRPGEIKDYITMAIAESGAAYIYNAKGSTINFSKGQIGRFINFLRDALKSDILEDDEKQEIKSTLQHVLGQLR